MPENGQQMRKKWILWLGSALAAGFLLISTFSDRRSGTTQDELQPTEEDQGFSQAPGKGSALVRTRESPLSSSLGLRRSTRAGTERPASPLRAQTGRRSRGIPTKKLFDSGSNRLASRSVTPAAAFPAGVAQFSDFPREQGRPLSNQGNGPSPRIAGWLYDEVAELERGYQAARAWLFGGSGRAFGALSDDPDDSYNPFDEALGDGSAADESDGGDTGESGDTVEGNGDSGGDSGTGNGDSGGDLGGPTEPPFFDFLITGAVGATESGQLHRAWRASSTVFVLEDLRELVFQPGFTPFNLFDDQQLYFGDADGDGDLDITVVSLIPTIGSTVETFLQTDNGFELGATILTYLRSVLCLEYFDFGGSPEKELVITFEGEPNVHIYEPVDGVWIYWDEVVLSFLPGVLIKTTESEETAGSLLYIVSEDFKVVANVLAVRPDIVRFTSQLPLTRRRFMNVRWQGESSSQENNLMAVEMADKIVLLDWSATRWRWIASLTGSPFQQTIIGYYNGNRRRQMLWIR